MRRRGVLARDGLSFFVLSVTSAALFVFTLFFFRSLEAHRQALGRKLTEQGRAALTANDPKEAAIILRQALTFEEDFPTQILLVDALGAAGQTQEAINYVEDLRDSQPGSGMLNLQLAHLYAAKGETSDAVASFRSAILGDWQGDGALRRREIRLDLASYLTEHGQSSAAREEVLTAVGNAPETLAYDLLFARQLQKLGDAQGASELYAKARKLEPHNYDALAGSGESAYSLGDYASAAKFFSAALEAPHASGKPQTPPSEIEAVAPAAMMATMDRGQAGLLATKSARLSELDLTRSLPTTIRAEHLLHASQIAKARLQTCMAQQSSGGLPSASAKPEETPAGDPLKTLASQWQSLAPQIKQRNLNRDAALGDQVASLVYETERATSTPCEAPQGDDALLLMLANGNNHP